MEPSKDAWLKALSDTMDRWRDAQRVAQGGKDALEEYLDATDCPLCNLAKFVCAHCIVSKILGDKCHELISYKRLVVARGVEAVAEAIRLMFIDMNYMYDKVEGGDTDEEVDHAETVHCE